jgi:hypothetical protein
MPTEDPIPAFPLTLAAPIAPDSWLLWLDQSADTTTIWTTWDQAPKCGLGLVVRTREEAHAAHL